MPKEITVRGRKYVEKNQRKSRNGERGNSNGLIIAGILGIGLLAAIQHENTRENLNGGNRKDRVIHGSCFSGGLNQHNYSPMQIPFDVRYFGD